MEEEGLEEVTPMVVEKVLARADVAGRPPSLGLIRVLHR